MNPYLYKIKDFSNYDGDSFDLTLDFGFDLVMHEKCRIFGLDTPELRGGTPESKKAGYLAKDRATEIVQTMMDDEGAFFLSENYAGKFGRPLGNIVGMIDGVVVNLRDALIAENLGVEYHGQAKRDIQDEHDKNLAILQEQGKI